MAENWINSRCSEWQTNIGVSSQQDRVRFVISECCTLLNALRKHDSTKSTHVSAILGDTDSLDNKSSSLINEVSNCNLNSTSPPTTVNRWSNSVRGKNGLSIGKFGDVTVILCFSTLKSQLDSVQNLQNFDTLKLVWPFTLVLTSFSIPVSICSMAIITLTKFISHKLINHSSPNLCEAIKRIIHSIGHCNIDTTDTATEEIIKLRLLKLIECLFTTNLAYFATDDCINTAVGFVLTTCLNSKHTELLRRTAEISLISIFPPLLSGLRPSQNELLSYNVTSVSSILKRLIDAFSDGDERRVTDSTRMIVLRLVNALFEAGGDVLMNHHDLAWLVSDGLCRALFRLSRTENSIVLIETFRVCITLFTRCRGVMKPQLEHFLTHVLLTGFPKFDLSLDNDVKSSIYDGAPLSLSVLKSQSTSMRATNEMINRAASKGAREKQQRANVENDIRKREIREACTECVCSMLRIPWLMRDIFINFDCDVEQNDLFSDMVNYLARCAMSDAELWSTKAIALLCLSGLVDLVHTFASSMESWTFKQCSFNSEEVERKRKSKQAIVQACDHFNDDAKSGIAYAVEHGLIEPKCHASSVAEFIKSTRRIDKKALGEYISKKSNEKILAQFLEQFEFSGKRIDEALREVLLTFRLPGESPLIERIVKEFSDVYYRQAKPGEIAGKDAVYVLTYAIIMLNTDQHNRNVRSQARMSLDDFKRNLRGVNGDDKGDFEGEFLEKIYDSIRTNEIILPEEHDTRQAFEYAWKDVCMRSQGDGWKLVEINDETLYGDMFTRMWKVIVGALHYVFTRATEDVIFYRVITALHECAQLAGKLEREDILDSIIVRLSTISCLGGEWSVGKLAMNAVVKVSDKDIMISEAAIRLGKDFRGQLALIALFRVIEGNENVVGEIGWKSIIEIILNLAVNSLVDGDVIKFLSVLGTRREGDDCTEENTTDELGDTEEKAVSQGGLFSALTWYVTSFGTDEPSEPSEQEIELALCAIDCVRSCNMERVVENIKQLNGRGLEVLITTILKILRRGDNEVKERWRESVSKRGILLELGTYLVVREERVWERHGEEVLRRIEGILSSEGKTDETTKGIDDDLGRIAIKCLFYLFQSRKCEVVTGQGQRRIDDRRVWSIVNGVKKRLIKRESGRIFKEIKRYYDEGLNKLGNGEDEAKFIEPPREFWMIVERIYTNSNAHVSHGIFELTKGMVEDENDSVYVQLENFNGLMGLVEVISLKSENIVRKLECLNILFKLKEFYIINSVVVDGGFNKEGEESLQGQRGKKVKDYWEYLFSLLETFARIFRREGIYKVKGSALTWIERILLSNSLTKNDHENGEKIFSRLLFPMIWAYLDEESGGNGIVEYTNGAKEAWELRNGLMILICRAFVQHLFGWSERLESIGRVWREILRLLERISEIESEQMDRLKRRRNGGRGKVINGGEMSIRETIHEYLKNILLVMMTSEYLVEGEGEAKGKNPDNASPEDIEVKISMWNDTKEYLERIVPGFFEQVLRLV